MIKMETTERGYCQGRCVLTLPGILLCILFSKPTFADIIVLDDFSTFASDTITVTPAPGSSTGSSNSSGGQVVIAKGETVSWQDTLSGLPFSTRKVNVVRQNLGSETSTVSVGYNLFDVSHPVGGTLTINVSYEGTTANLSSADTFNISVAAKDSAAVGNLTPTLTLFSGVTSSQATFSAPLVVGINSIRIRDMLMSLNAAQISKVQLSLVVPSDVDVTLDSLYFAPVPEPGFVGLGLACLLAFAVLRRKKSGLPAVP